MVHTPNHPPPSLPEWTPPLDTGQPSAGDINDLSDVPRTNYAARNSVVPICYGRDRFFGKPFIVTIDDPTGDLVVAYAFGEGEFSGYEGIYVDNDNVITSGRGYFGLKNGGFQSGDEDGWIQLEGGTIVANEGRSGTGDYALRMPTLAGGPSALSERLPVPYDEATIRVKGYARRDPASLPDANAFLVIRTATTVGGALTFQTVSNFTGDCTAESTTSGWQYLEGYFTLPAGVVEFVINVSESDGTTGHWFWDDIHFDFVKANGDELDPPLMEFTLYSGSPVQGADGILSRVLPGTVHAHLGLAYVVGRFPPKSTSGFPRLEGIVNGRKVFDPRKYNLIYDTDADPLFTTAAESVLANAKWFTSPGMTVPMANNGWTVETADPSPAGATYAELIDNSNDSDDVFSQEIPVDPTKTYTVTIYAKQPSGDRRNYLTVAFKDAFGNNISGGDPATGWTSKGTYFYWSIANTTFAATWTKYTFSFGPGGTAQLPQNTVPATMQIGLLGSRDGAVGTNTTIRIADLRVFEGLVEHDETDNTTWEYTTNPALCFRDMIKNFSGWSIWDHGVVDLANYNEEDIGGGVPRRQIGLTMTKPDTIEKWTKVWRTYMGGFLGWEDGRLRVVPNRAETDRQGGITFDQSASTWVDMGDQAVLDMDAAQDFTIECEILMNPAVMGVTQTVIAKKTTPAGLDAGYSIHFNASDQLVFQLHDGTNGFSYTDTTTNYFDGNWHHIAMSINQTNNELIAYVDRVAKAPVSITALLTMVNAAAFRVGATSGGTDLMYGTVDELRVWTDVRTPAEIAANTNELTETQVADTTLAGYWKFNELPAETSAADASANGNAGTLSGSALFVTGNTQIIPDGVVLHLTADDIVKDTLRLRRRSLRSTPNSVAVDYRDSSGTRWITERAQSDSPRLTAGDERRRMSRVSLPGIHNATQAKREATERLNWYLTDLEATVTIFDEGWQLQNGAIVAVTHPIGLDAKLFRVVRMTGKSGRWTLDLVEYDPAVYSSEVVSDPTIPDTNLGNPLNPPLPTITSATEELFQYKNGNYGSRIRIQLGNIVYPFFSQFLIEGYVGGVKVWDTLTQSTEIVTPPVEELVEGVVPAQPIDYTVRAYTQSPFATSDFASEVVNVLGKFEVPSDVPSLTIAQTAADQVELSWGAATDIDIWRYEIRRGTTSDTWATATQIPNTLLIDGLSTVRTGIPNGTYRFFVKARDSVGNESVNAKSADITLAAPDPVTGLTGFEIASEVRLSWNAPTTGYPARYRIAYDTIPASDEITLDIVDTLRFSTKDVPEGTWRFLVYTRDRTGAETATAATIDIEVTSDADSFLADTYDFVQATTATPTIVTNGTLTNMHQYSLRTDTRLLYVTNMGDAFLSSPSDFNTYSAVPLANYHSSGNSLWLSETKDFGLLLTGSWNLTHDVETLGGTVAITLELSTDNISFSTYTGAAKGEFRYARVRIATTTTSTAFVKSPVMGLKINVVPLEESGESVGSPTAAATINLAREYTAVKEVNAQPKYAAGGDSTMAIVDNIIVGGNTGVQTDVNNYLDGGDLADLEFAGSATVEFWMKHTGGTSNGLIVMGKRNSVAAGWSVQFDELAEDVIFIVDDGVDEVSLTLTDACPNDGSWHHIAFVLDRGANVLRGYADGVADVSTPSTTLVGTLASGTVPFRIFANNSGLSRWANGMIDEVRIWDDVRSPAEIANNMTNELDMTQTQANLIHYWQMNGTVGASVTTIADRTAGVTAPLTDTGAGDIVYIDVGTDPNNTITKINSFDVYVFDIFGQQLNDAFQWNWKGV